MFGPWRGEIMGGWRKLHNGKLHNFYSSPDIIRQIKSRRMRWAGMWHTWERGGKYTVFWWESPKERDHLKDLGIDRRMGLGWVLGK
jgi:hypothetical protein